MTRGAGYDDERDPEEPEDFDRDDDPFGTDTEPCPFCREEVHEETDICPYCGNFILRDDLNPRPGGLWWITGIALLIIVLYFILAGGRFF